MRFVVTSLFAITAGMLALPVAAVQTVKLSAGTCVYPDSVFGGGFDTAPTNPSNGGGGAVGSITRNVHVAGLGGTLTQAYYLYVPANYTPARTWPVLLALHGVAPYPDTYAASVRDDWSSAASAGGFIVAAPVAHDVLYNNNVPYAASWLVPPTVGPNDYDEFAAILSDLEAAYNVERTRIYGWGFSAGGHVMHDLGVNTYSSAFNASTMAAYGVSAGDLHGLACQNLSDAQCNALLAALPRKIPVDIHIGESDPNYPYAQTDHARFVASGWSNAETIFYSAFLGGHDYTVTQLGDIWHNLCPNAVTP
jgi:poly(3-hydroxybutyrate) depolymerase